jgi:glycerol kinase
MGKYLVALDQGTTSSRSILYSARLEKLDQVQKEFTQHFPRPGWVEHDPEEIWHSQFETLRSLIDRNGIKPSDIAAIGITNQRETVVAWDRETGRPLARAIVWQDRRTAAWCQALRGKGLEPGIRKKTGLVIDPYFSGSKMRWLLANDPKVKQAAADRRLAFGTVDSWLIHKLTGGDRHVIEAGNASRTLLMDLRSRAWDRALLKIFGVPAHALPEILDSDAYFGACVLPGLEGVKIHGAAGDQQASLFGHRCLAPGSRKNTYGTGCFLLKNVGTAYQPPPKGLLGTVAWTLKGKTTYAHEGAVMVAGAAIQFLRDSLGLIAAAPESQALAESLDGNDGVFFVPAFAGLGTPHWDPDARGLLVGLTRGTTRAHLARAALEAIAFQSLDLVEAMDPPRIKGGKGAAGASKPLNVDGGASQNAFLMQFQADVLGAEVKASDSPEITALGVAMLAGLGCGLIASEKELLRLDLPRRTYKPSLPPARRRRLIAQWRAAVERSKGWQKVLDRP